MAQIINYHQWPQGYTSGISAYTTGTNGISMPQLDPTSFNWNDMTDDEIARLMLYCGQSVNMDYDIYTSGAGNPESVFKDIFGYSKAVAGTLGVNFSPSHWEEILYNDLENGRPVYYSGSNSLGGHAFVVDGYKDGLFHINWGWDGDGDGYFLITGITEDIMPYPYDYLTDGIFGIEAPANDVSLSGVIVKNCSFFPRSVYRNNSSEDFQQKAQLSSNLLCDYDGVTFQVGYGLYQNGNLVKVLTQKSRTFPESDSYIENVIFTNDIPIGEYQIIPIYRHNESDDWSWDVNVSRNQMKAIVSETSLVFYDVEDGTNGDANYIEYGISEIDGVTYKLTSEFGNNWAYVLPYKVTGKYVGDVVVPNKVSSDDRVFVVLRDEFDPFSDCPDLTSLKCGAEAGITVDNCVKLSSLILTHGETTSIRDCPLLENLDFPITMDYPCVWNCEKLQTIRINCPAVSFPRVDVVNWDDASLPALKDVYMPSSVPPVIKDNDGNVPANSHATLHVPKGSLNAYKNSRWGEWNVVDDQSAGAYITWGYCHNDAISSSGMSSGMGDNDAEYAMRVPAEEMGLYVGSKITHIQIFSSSRSINDFGYENYEYVFITKPGTDYIVKQPFEVVRGAWNTVKLDNPCTITGDSLYIGIGRHSRIGIRFSDDTYVLDASWQRPMGDDYGDSQAMFVPGKWVLPCPVDQAHPLPIRFAIEGDDVPEGVVIREFQLDENGTTMRGVLRNRSLEAVNTVTVEWTVDGSQTSKTYETHIAPNGCESVTFELPESVKDGGYHEITADVTSFNGGENPFVGKYLPKFTIGAKSGIFTATIEEGVTMTFKILDEEAKTCQVGDGEVGSASIDKSTPGTVTIPNEVNGYKVIGIGDYGFYECAELVNVYLPETLEFIGKFAFYGCKKLKTVKIRSIVTEVADNAFDDCDDLVEIETPYNPVIIKIVDRRPIQPVIIITKPIRSDGTSEDDGLEEVVIPKPVTEIGQRSFSYCPSIRLMKVEEGNTVFDSREDCNAIIKTADDLLLFGCKNTVIPNSIKSIDAYAFEGHSKLTTIKLPRNITSIGESAFSGCTGLVNVISKMKTPFAINDNTFSAETYANATLTVPYGTKEAYSTADGWKNFVNIVESLNDITFVDAEVKRLCVENWDTDHDGELSFDEAEEVRDLGEVFKANTVITSFNELQYFTGLNEIGRLAFSQCVNLTSVVIPNSVKTLCYSAFFQSGLTSIDFPESVETLDYYVFDRCNSLKSVFIPKTVTTIMANPFKECVNIESISVEADNPNYNSKEDCNAIIRTKDNVLVSGCKNTKILDGITIIGDYAFQGCDGLKTVELPSSVTKLDVYSFSYCPNLSQMVVLSETPAVVGLDAFRDLPSSAILFVPFGSKEKYEEANGWKEFKNIIEVGGPESITISSAKQVTYMSDKDLDFTGYPDLKAYVATGYDKASGTIWLTRVKEVPANTGFLLMGEADTYEIPVTSGGSSSYYMNLFKGTIEGTIIQTTDGDNTNYYLSNGDAGVGFYKVQSSVELKPNRAYLSVPTEIPAVGAAGNTETIKVSAAGQVPYYNSQSLDFSSLDAQGVKAYTATGYDYSSGTIWLTRVKQVPAETGILIMAPQGEYPVPTASVASVYANMFKGTLTGTTIQTHETIAGEDYINYYLSSGDAGVGFYKVTKEGGVTIGANRCYLPIKNKDAAGTRSAGSGQNQIAFEEADEVIGIQLMRGIGDDNDGTTNLTPALSKGEGEWYTLQGQRVAKPGKGLYIRNGKVVVIK